MTPEQMDEALALFDRVNGIGPDETTWPLSRLHFKLALSRGPGIALGAVIDACLPQGWTWTHTNGVFSAFPPDAEVGMFFIADHPALALVRAIRAAMDAEGEG